MSSNPTPGSVPSSVLLHLNGIRDGESVIDAGVALASRWKARLRGVTLLDTRNAASLSTNCEAAVYANDEFNRLHLIEQQQEKIRSRLSQACLAAGIDFDVRSAQGNPLELLPPESQFHDLMVTFYAPTEDSGADLDAGSKLTAAEMVDLLVQGVQPMLVVRRPQQALNRVLLVYDGTPTTGKAVRNFLSQDFVSHPEFRLVAIGNTEQRARTLLREMLDYCHTRRIDIEAGSLCGTIARSLPAYALKWEADCVVLGVARRSWGARKLLGEPVRELLHYTSCAVYLTS